MAATSRTGGICSTAARSTSWPRSAPMAASPSSSTTSPQRLALESRYNAMIDTQRETLDSLKEGVAVFAPDGRLQLFNKSFAQVWKLSRKMLAEGPHIDAIIAAMPGAVRRRPRPVAADHRARSPASPIAARPSTGQIRARRSERDRLFDRAAAGRRDADHLRRRHRCRAAAERALIERNEALIAADRLKSQFISHVSYELRTPLTRPSSASPI